MKQVKEKPVKRPRHLKRKLASAMVMLLVSSILMTTVTYAWLVLSIAPEVRGISTSIGGNGSLEIALLNTNTRQDLTTIGTAAGMTLSDRDGDGSVNETWGNLVDLEVGSYGLEEIILLPARLNVTGDSANVNSLLAVPSYDFDGRIKSLNTQTFSTTYSTAENAFAFELGSQDYGVRAIGTADAVTVQQAALSAAKSNVATYTNSAKAAAKGAMEDNANGLFNIIIAKTTNGGFDDEDLDTLSGMLSGLQSAYNYIDKALRQGLIAVAASEIGNVTTFEAVQERIENAASVSAVLSDLEEVSEVPEEFAGWATTLATSQNKLNVTQSDLAALRQNENDAYTWEELSAILKPLMDVDQVLLNGDPLSNISDSAITELLNSPIELLLGPGSGEFATVADFAGDYTASVDIMNGATIRTASAVDPAHLVNLRATVLTLEPAESESTDSTVEMTTTYAYALDLAFRCNAPLGNLLLQTAGTQRVYEDSTSTSTMGGGSYMAFTSFDENYSVTQQTLLMDSVRVAFLDDAGTILGIAKLNTSNISYEEGVLKAPLYLYDYEFVDDGNTSVKMLSMGERRKTDNIITDLRQNVAKAVTVVVWLDGDTVDNSMVSATESVSLSGTLNLQFATDADLVPAANDELKELTADKDTLNEYVNNTSELPYANTYNNGQLTYTTVSWQAFVSAYDYAVAINNSDSANDIQIYNAMRDLVQAHGAMEEVDLTALGGAIDEMRLLMGETEDVAGYVVEKTDGSYSFLSEYTEAQIAGNVGTVKQVDYSNNLRDEGNDVYTAIYTDESWNALAAAIYQAEAIYMMKDAEDESVYITDDQMDAAITALDLAHEALEHRVLFVPYDYNGSIYYYAYPVDETDTDTYGKWYDSDFKRVVADRTIILLDADAEEVTAGIVNLTDGYAWNTEDELLPYFSINETLYPELKGEEIIAMMWNEDEIGDYFVEMMSSWHTEELAALISEAEEFSEYFDAVNWLEYNDLISNLNSWAQEGQALLDTTDPVTAAAAERVIWGLEYAVGNARDTYDALIAEYNPYMTEDQRIVLTAAINAAKAVEGYDATEPDPEAPDLTALKSAVAAAETVLAADYSTITNEQAAAALDSVNAQLKALGEKEVTAYNTIVHTIPGDSESDIVYSVKHPTLALALTGKTGTATLKGTLLTKNGVIMRAEKEITVYTPYDSISWYSYDGVVSTYNVLTVGESLTFGADLVYYAARQDKEYELGNCTVDEDGAMTIAVRDQIKEYVWTVTRWSYDSDGDEQSYTDIAELIPSADGKGCTVKGVSEGTLVIQATAYSALDGHAYISYEIEIDITESTT